MVQITKPCVDCGTEITGAPQKRTCAECHQKRNRVKTVRTLRAGETPPDGPPRRYKSSHGYVRLRWRVDVRSYVETYEHRLVAGAIAIGRDVHHVNHDKTDNAPSNLAVLEAHEHTAKHGKRYDVVVFATLYGQGLSTQAISKMTGADPATIWRSLKRHGVEMRSHLRVNLPRVSPSP